MAVKHFDIVAADPQAEASLKEMNAAVLAAARGDWAHAGETLKAIVDRDADNYVVGVSVYRLFCFVCQC